MQEHHLHRILALLGDWDSHKITGGKYHHNLLQPKHNHYTQWKWFVRDIGKQNSILALLPFTEMALHISQTPLPTQYKHDVESYDSLRKKINLVIAWAEKPTNQTKNEVAQRLQKSKEYRGFGLPTTAAESFINNLLAIIVAERKFQRHVDYAFRNLKEMGYHDYFAESVFKAEVLAIYREKLNNRTSD